MSSLSWKSEYETGIRSVDEDHKGLFRLCGEFEDALAAADDPAEVNLRPVIGKLKHYIGEHFAREERFMRRAGYHDFAEHKRRHDELTAQVRALGALHEIEPEAIDADKLLAFLKAWLVHHILEEDLAFVPSLRPSREEPRAEEPPSEAEEEDHPPRVRRIDITVRVSDLHAPLVRRVAEICDTETTEARELRAALHQFVDRYERSMIARAKAAFGRDAD